MRWGGPSDPSEGLQGSQDDSDNSADNDELSTSLNDFLKLDDDWIYENANLSIKDHAATQQHC